MMTKHVEVRGLCCFNFLFSISSMFLLYFDVSLMKVSETESIPVIFFRITFVVLTSYLVCKYSHNNVVIIFH